jgi:hypothetical protein
MPTRDGGAVGGARLRFRFAVAAPGIAPRAAQGYAVAVLVERAAA